MGNEERILTLVVKVKDTEAAKAIWETHAKNGLLAGCQVRTIADGDKLEDLEQHEGYVEHLHSLNSDIPTFEDWQEENG